MNSVISFFCVDKDKIGNVDLLLAMPYIAMKGELRNFQTSLKEVLMMIKSGVSIVEAIDHLSYDGSLSAGIFRSIKRDISDGVALDAAFRASVKPLDSLLSILLSLEIGDRSHWEKVFNNAIEYLEYKIALSNSLRSALAYPLVVLCVLNAVVWFQVMYIFPIFGVTMYFIPVMLTSVLFLGMLLAIFADKIGLGITHHRACYFHSIASSMAAGMSLQKSLSMVSKIFGGSELEQIELCVLCGGKFCDALEDFPDVVRSLIRVGELSDSLDLACKHVSEFYLNKTKQRLEWISFLAGPILIASVGLILTFVVRYTMDMYYAIFIR